MKPYEQQAQLVVRVLPFIAKHECFALKGGTAINFFERDLPRLSVDIDLSYSGLEDREFAARKINSALEEVAGSLTRIGIRAVVSGGEYSRKMVCSHGGIYIKVEPNYILRGTLFPTRKMQVTRKVEERFGFCTMNVLSFGELYGGKICAALDRQHPRDLFDIAQLYQTRNLDEEIKAGFLAMALSHNRPLHELLDPNLQDNRIIYEQQFKGMTELPFSYDEHVAVFERLKRDVKHLLGDADKRRLVEFCRTEIDASGFGIAGLEQLPGIKWKKDNLRRLKRENPDKLMKQAELLEQALH